MVYVSTFVPRQLAQICWLIVWSRKGTLATILSPTKELALQTLKVATDLTRMVPSLVSGAVAGGEKPKSEKARLRKGMVLLCATPGRLSYHLEHTATFVATLLSWKVDVM